MTQVKLSALSQAEVEQRTGLSREVLRKWELRYQFPTPQRGARGQRQYLASDVERLQLISQLIQQGLRAGALVRQNAEQLQSLLDARCSHALPAAPTTTALDEAVQQLLATLAPQRSPNAVTLFLQAQISQHGLATFVAHHMPSFNRAVGNAWQAEQLSIATEHHFTATLRQVVLHALPVMGHTHAAPRVLLTTPPGELHGLGLLALYAQLSLQGADCVDLGTQTPLPEVLQAARELQVGVVAISASACQPLPELRSYLQGLRQGLPETCAVWAGGYGCTSLEATALTGCEVFNDTSQAVGRWRAMAKARREAAN
jgi:methanogenic corrinoid protein MtbC1